VKEFGEWMPNSDCQNSFIFLEDQVMLRWSLLFLIIALVAGVFGFWGLEGTAMQIAKVLFFIFLIIFIVSLVLGRRGPSA
jgi:uncharacterized membrane protein YtjA (UPF0391 family)